jgi:hypothetical protein
MNLNTTKVNLLSLMTASRQFTICRLPSGAVLRVIHLHFPGPYAASELQSELAQLLPFRKWPGHDLCSLAQLEVIKGREPHD